MPRTYGRGPHHNDSSQIGRSALRRSAERCLARTSGHGTVRRLIGWINQRRQSREVRGDRQRQCLPVELGGHQAQRGQLQREHRLDTQSPCRRHRCVAAHHPDGATSADSPAGGTTVDNGNATTPVCGPLSLPAGFPLLGLRTACSYSHAATGGGAPAAKAYGGSVDTLSVSAGSVLGAGGLLAPVGDVVNTLLSQLGQIVNPVPQVSQLTALLQGLLTGQGTAVATIQIGTNTSSAEVTSSAITATSTSTGAKVCVGQLAPGPPPICLVTVTVGTAAATASCSRTSYTATPTIDPSIVKVELFPAAFDALKQLPVLGSLLPTLFPNTNGTPTLTLQAGQSLDLSPLIKIVGSSGSTSKTANGASASAASLGLDVLPDPNTHVGLVSLALSEAQAAVSCTAPVKAQVAPSTTTPAPPKKLAFTGDNPWRPVLGVVLLAVAAAGLEVLRRARRRDRTATGT